MSVVNKKCQSSEGRDDNFAKSPSNEILGPRISKWAVGITIAPREKEYHAQTIDSVIRAGWKLPHLFLEPGVKLEKRHELLPLTKRTEKHGCWKNWFEGLKDLIKIYPDAGCYGMIQDDVIFCKGVRVFLEHVLWPSDDLGFVSVFTPSHYTSERPGFYKRNKNGKLWMAQTFFFPPSKARKCVRHKIISGHTGDKNIDNIVGRWAFHSKSPPYYFVPSLAQHIGVKSTIWSNDRDQARGRKSASDFVGEDHDLSCGMI
jgi:hypothetical protein